MTNTQSWFVVVFVGVIALYAFVMLLKALR
jgi:hypothetical protein